MATPISAILVHNYNESIARQVLEHGTFLSKWLHDEQQREAEMTRKFGPMHGPGRRERWRVWEHQRKVERHVRFLERARGHVAGPFVRAGS